MAAEVVGAEGLAGCLFLGLSLLPNSGTVTVAGGGAGAGGVASGGTATNGSAGSAGSSGLSSIALYSDVYASLQNTFFPINLLDF